MGDLNGHVGLDRTGIENVLGAFSIGDRNRGESIIDFCIQSHMSIMNTFYKLQESQKWIWYRWNTVRGLCTDKSMIDLALSKNKNLFRDVKSAPSVSLDSNHRLLLIKLKLNKPKTVRGQRRTRFCLEKLQIQECRGRYKNEISHRRTQDEVGNSNEKCLSIKRGIQEVVADVLQTKVVGNRPKKQTPCWNAELKKCVETKMKFFRKWMKTRRIEGYENYMAANRETEIRKKLSKQQSWEKICEDLRNDLL